MKTTVCTQCAETPSRRTVFFRMKTAVCAALALVLACIAAQGTAQTDTVSESALPPMQNVFPDGNKKLHITYTDKVFPGDAAFIRLALEDGILEKAQALLFVDTNEKVLASAELYEVPPAERGRLYIALIPLSSWYEPGDFHIKLTYRLRGKKEKALSLPVAMQKKDFVSETVHLDAKNTAIRTNTADEKRQAQIKRLNDILGTVNYSAVYHSGQFGLPVTQTRRTSFFADRRVYAYSNGKSATSLHYGIDFGVPEGTPVFSCGDGKVVLAENRISTGYSVIIEHLPGMYSLYYHLSSYSVKEGDTVKRGEQIGLSGATGLATGPHLHWEVRLLGQAVNPDLFVQYFPN